MSTQPFQFTVRTLLLMAAVAVTTAIILGTIRAIDQGLADLYSGPNGIPHYLTKDSGKK
jgi:hypothetical protein